MTKFELRVPGDKLSVWDGGTMGQRDSLMHDLVEYTQNAMFAPPARHPVHRARWRKNRGSEFKVQSSRFKVQGSIPYHLSLITSIASAVGAAIVLGGECLGLACESDAAECDGRQDNCPDNDDL